jgi:hypothetical protein
MVVGDRIVVDYFVGARTSKSWYYAVTCLSLIFQGVYDSPKSRDAALITHVLTTSLDASY